MGITRSNSKLLLTISMTTLKIQYKMTTFLNVQFSPTVLMEKASNNKFGTD